MKKLFFLFLCTTLLACSNQEETLFDVNKNLGNEPDKDLLSHRISTEQAILNSLEFVNNIGNSTRSNKGPLTVSEVKAIGYHNEKTRSLNDSIDLDSLFYIVNFDNNEGYVIASSDDRETPVFAYIEKGNYEEDDTLNNGYEAFIDALIDMEIATRTSPLPYSTGDSPTPEGEINGSPTYRPDKFEVMLPALVTKWDQTTYNRYCPDEYIYTGCVVTAVSQICSFLKMPNQVTWAHNGLGNHCNIDWDDIINECNSNYGNLQSGDLIDQVANLMRFWGIAFDADYESGGTSVDSEYAISVLQDLGYNATDLTDYNISNVISELKTGDRVLFMRGNARYYHVGFVFRKYVDGHAWVVDGYIDSVKNNKESFYIHCNWGWRGDCNGYFLHDILNAEEIPYYDDNANVLTRSNNYRYKLKTSSISK